MLDHNYIIEHEYNPYFPKPTYRTFEDELLGASETVSPFTREFRNRFEDGYMEIHLQNSIASKIFDAIKDQIVYKKIENYDYTGNDKYIGTLYYKNYNEVTDYRWQIKDLKKDFTIQLSLKDKQMRELKKDNDLKIEAFSSNISIMFNQMLFVYFILSIIFFAIIV